MNYIGTRGFREPRTFAGALLDGLAPDGGLYVPETYPVPDFDLNAASAGDYGLLTEKLLTLFGVDVLGADAVQKAAARTRAAFLNSAGQTPLVQVEDNLWILELWHGPTLAFKDMAMQMIAPLTDAALAQRGEKLTLVTATSGDTGAAAVRAFAGSEHVRLVVFHPLGRVSPVQRLQMTTVEADNVLNIGVEGDFDDCQRMVKRLLGEEELKQYGLISSVNSINWGRLLGQVPYYLAAAAASGADHPEFVVPTGNFGDAFAGWVGRKIGGNVGHIHAAVNSNDALAQAINTGHYVRRPAVETASVSMDVQAPSNFERLIFEASGRQAEGTKGLFDNFNATGNAFIAPDLQDALNAQVTASSISEDETKATIAYAYKQWNRVICPHTAVAVAAALKRGKDQAIPQIALSTAHAAKFPAFVTSALGFAPEVPEAIQKLHGQKETIHPIRNDEFAAMEAVKAFQRRA
ncbi:threonine synthase [Asticcacaulis sp. AC466]|uniref:threonine synthase n=1 Tax=Asticcacaulis sp. AC466 TaxID=1282362 RepID=UPI00042301CB|nr:threonine synthase [Asticcacaulis sp. AC466]